MVWGEGHIGRSISGCYPIAPAKTTGHTRSATSIVFPTGATSICRPEQRIIAATTTTGKVRRDWDLEHPTSTVHLHLARDQTADTLTRFTGFMSWIASHSTMTLFSIGRRGMDGREFRSRGFVTLGMRSSTILNIHERNKGVDYFDVKGKQHSR